ncbi:hypothetical protein PENTCL1PPCAC_28173 [Pristionchus entomophagus]|uniref:Uncharacterized protein n=1 Tax=Pristionchus entomophagus TaxID=358040 RepID=A0AAV5UHY2_9BILA|nr:hypothetical protein PENTCL1PPCAC_28173 [Pristionchus entomophagus]
MNLATALIFTAIPLLTSGFLWNNREDETLLDSIQRLDEEWSRGSQAPWTILNVPDDMVVTEAPFRISREEADAILTDFFNATSPLSFFATSYLASSNETEDSLNVQKVNIVSSSGSHEQFSMQLVPDTSVDSIETED